MSAAALEAVKGVRLRVDHIRRQIVDGQAVALADIETLQKQVVDVEQLLEGEMPAGPATDKAGSEEADDAGALV